MTEPHPPTTLDSAAASSIARLRAGFDGRVIDRDDPRYDQARAVFAGGIDRFPAVIVRPTNA
ncbi:MAG TPA: hypothetical protein VFR23_18225, partial [Jiangellaceae bacterium]|nr:hypothetical protein [Jiangellaceae bacterium]